jgi:hypothetical protein
VILGKNQERLGSFANLSFDRSAFGCGLLVDLPHAALRGLDEGGSERGGLACPNRADGDGRKISQG